MTVIGKVLKMFEKLAYKDIQTMASKCFWYHHEMNKLVAQKNALPNRNPQDRAIKINHMSHFEKRNKHVIRSISQEIKCLNATINHIEGVKAIS